MADPQYIRAGWLIDGSGGDIRKNVWLTVRDGRIAEIVAATDTTPPPQLPFTDLSHCTLLPPLIDCKVHLIASATTIKEERGAILDSKAATVQTRRNIHYCLTHGVLGVADHGGSEHLLPAEPENSKNHQAVFVKHFTQETTQHKTHQVNDLRLFPTPWKPLQNQEPIDTGGNGFIRIIYTEEVYLHHPQSVTTLFPVAELQQKITEAKLKGNRVIVVANGNDHVGEAIAAGCDAVEQGYAMGEKNMQDMAASGITWIPSITPLTTLNSAGEKEVMEQKINGYLEQLASARRHGVAVAIGSGAGCSGIIHGEATINELKYFLKAGYTLSEAIRCACKNGAEFLSIEETGVIAEGREATFLVSRGTPAQMPRKLLYLEAIYRKGEPCPLYKKNPVKTIT